jgi:soluble lytic murein transglycosylase-like protein
MARKGLRFSLACAIAAAALADAGPGAAQVLSIGDDGTVTTYSGPAIFDDAGVRPIAPPAEAARFAPAEVARAIEESAARHAVPTSLVEAVAWQESRFNQAAVSRKGALGVMQLSPKTASDLGVDAFDLKSNIDGGAAYLARMIGRFGDVKLALAAYNAGPEAVVRYGGVPPFAETQTYVRAVLARLAAVPATGAGIE